MTVPSDDTLPAEEPNSAVALQAETAPRALAQPGARRWLLPAAVAAVLVVALWLRVYGVTFGLPNLYYWDEPTVVNRAMRFGTGDLNPHDFYYPALYMYVLFAASGVYFVAGRLLGTFHGAQEFALRFFVDPTGVYLTARITTALVGTCAVLIAYLVGKRYLGKTQGLVGAALLAVSPLHASYSHIAVTDIAHAALIALALLPLHDVLSRGRYRDYALAGLLIGLGTATKYLAGLQVGALVVAHWLGAHGPGADWRRPAAHLQAAMSRRLALGLLLVVAGFFVGSPYNFISAGEFIRDFRTQSVLSRGDGSTNWILLHTLPADLGWPALLLAIAGLAALLWRPSRSTLVLLVFPALYSLAMLRMSRSWSRYLLPSSTLVVLCAGQGWVMLQALAERWLRPRLGLVVASAILAASLLLPASTTLAWDSIHAIADSRDLALRWTEENVPTGTHVVLQSLFDRTFDNVPLVTDGTLARLDRIVPTGGSLGKVRGRVLQAWRTRPVYPDMGWEHDPADFARDDVKYVFLTDAYGPPPAPLQRWLDARGQIAARFTPEIPGALARSGGGYFPVLPPAITIYRMAP